MLTIDYDTKKSIREAFGKKLAELGAKNTDIVVLDADLSCSTQTKFFAKEFPERFFNVGIAEQNLITTASGLALTGKIPFAATFAVPPIPMPRTDGGQTAPARADATKLSITNFSIPLIPSANATILCLVPPKHSLPPPLAA